MSTALPIEAGCCDRPRSNAFSMITTSSPIQISPSSAVNIAPCSTRARSPRVTAPHSTADGATYADLGISGRSPRCVRIMTSERTHVGRQEHQSAGGQISSQVPTIYDWAGGRAAFERWLDRFYDLVEEE